MNVTESVAVEQHSSLFGGARGLAIKILSRVEQSDSYLDKVLDSELRNSELSARDKALLKELVTGTMRWMGKLDWILTGFYNGEFPKCIIPVKNAMRLALYQILFLDRIPPSAAVYESVEIIKRLKGERSANLVNAVLRRILANIDNIRYPSEEPDPTHNMSVLYSHPQWMVKRWYHRFGAEQTRELLQANNRRPKVAVRVNTLRATSETLAEQLQSADSPLEQSPWNPLFFAMSAYQELDSSPAFKQGLCSIQDTSASLAVLVGSPQPGETVVDLCAAPGGKSCFAAELMQNKGKVVALDLYEAKLRFIQGNAKRLGIEIIEAKADDARTFSPAQEVDLVLADVPCSGLGTLSKKPDIKWKREQKDLRALRTLQMAILDNAARIVRPGGRVVYSTCTTEPEENTEIIEAFLAAHPNFRLVPAETFIPAELCRDGMMQTFPHLHGIDGAFAARLERIQ